MYSSGNFHVFFGVLGPVLVQQCSFDPKDMVYLSEIRGACTHHISFDCIWSQADPSVRLFIQSF